MQIKSLILITLTFALSVSLKAQGSFSHQDSLFGGYGPGRDWWDVTFNHLDIEVFPSEKAIIGSNTIKYRVLKPYQLMQIELQDPLKITKIVQDSQELSYTRDGFSYFIELKKEQIPDAIDSITIFYGGKPHESLNPPWSGGITWTEDSAGAPFIASSCQGIGASIWWPCKDSPRDEPDSALISITVPDSLIDVSNGRLRQIELASDCTHTFHWYVDNPINNYGVNMNIAEYAHFSQEYDGLKGKLDCNYYVLKADLDKAKEQFTYEVPRMLEAFEYWFGPYPFYKDGYKLVQVPYLGMEHQSSVTYGNGFQNGYLGMNRSGTGWGLKFDFIIIHESGHEWWANSITAADVTDNWIHEGFTTYAEALFLNYYYGDTACTEYVIGLRKNISNSEPLIGYYDVRDGAPGDIYDKGANILHTLRQIVHNDDQFRNILHGLYTEFYHDIVYSSQVENYIDSMISYDLKPFFDTYLRSTQIPVFTYEIKHDSLRYRYKNVADGFEMPLTIYVNGEEKRLKDASDKWHSIAFPENSLSVDKAYYIRVERQ